MLCVTIEETGVPGHSLPFFIPQEFLCNMIRMGIRDEAVAVVSFHQGD